MLKSITGQLTEIGGIECYVSTPTGDFPKDKVILFFTDVFGIPLINNKVRLYSFADKNYNRTRILNLCHAKPNSFSSTTLPVMVSKPSCPTS